MGRPKKDPMERFMASYAESPTGCWEWKNSTSPSGYGKIQIDGKHQRAHRVAYVLFKGDIPEGIFVCHSCDNPRCVNPDHLWLGTHSENMIDMRRKGRGGKVQPRKLSDEQVAEIRARYASGGVTQSALAEEFGVGQPAISYIVNWKERVH